MKYYQQSLAKLAESMTDEEKEKIKTESKNFILRDDYFCRAFFFIKNRSGIDIRTYVLGKRRNSLRND